MKRRGVKSFDLVLFVLASPVLLLRTIVRGVRRVGFWQTAYTSSMACPNCDATISLVGVWRCHCGFTYQGHLLRVCPVCASLPRMVRCFECGVTESLPRP